MKILHHHSFLPMLLAGFVAFNPCLTLRAASLSELLEKGIYTEETKGDLDAAIGIYQQLVAEAKAGQALGAQAQLRLGLCLLKMKRETEAIVAFEKLIRDFPNEKELVARAREHLHPEIAFEPVPWEDGERLALKLTLAAGMEIGAMELRSDLVDSGGRKAWRVGRRMSGGGEMLSHTDIDPQTFQPLASYWKHTLLGEVTAVFRPGEVEITKAGAADSTKIRLDKPVFDNEECFHLARVLPLKPGYKISPPIITTLGGGGVIPIGMEVVKVEMVEVPAGKFECFKLQLSVGQTLWYSTDANRYLVKFEAGGAIGQLTSISKRPSGAPVAFRDDELGLSLAAPADWLVHRFTNGEPAKQVLIRTYDAAANATDGGLRLFETASLPAAARGSARAWAESNLRENKAGKVRPESWKNITVAGRPAVSCLVDFEEAGKRQVQHLVHAIGARYSEFFVISGPPEKFDALKTAFDGIIASYRTSK